MAASTLVSGVGFELAAVGKKRPEAVFEQLTGVAKLAEVKPASRLTVRPMPELASSGIRKLDALTGGFPRGCLTEVCGAASSGRTSVLLAALTAATGRQETCALVDARDAFDPKSAARAGVDFERLLWVRCDGQGSKLGESCKSKSGEFSKKNVAAASVEQALRVTDLLLQSGGFGLIVLDLGSVPLKIARRVPLASWFRFQRAVERTATILFLITPAPCAQTCANLLLKVRGKNIWSASATAIEDDSKVLDEGYGFDSYVAPGSGTTLYSGERKNIKSAGADAAPLFQSCNLKTHAQLLDGLFVSGEVLRSRLERKPVQSTLEFVTKAG